MVFEMKIWDLPKTEKEAIIFFQDKGLLPIKEAPFGGGGLGWGANAHPRFSRGAQASTTKGPLPAIIIHYVQHNPFCPIDLKLLHAY